MPHVADGAQLRVLHRAQHREQGHEATRIVDDAEAEVTAVLLSHGDIAAFGKDRVEMRGDHQQRRVRLPFPLAHSVALADHIARGIDADVGQTRGAQAFGEIPCPHRFLERRRGNLRDGDLFLERARIVIAQELQGGLHRRLALEPGDRRVRRLHGRVPEQGREQQRREAHRSFHSHTPAGRTARPVAAES
jgi:hypothetical protein